MTDAHERLRSKLVFDPLSLDQELIELPMLIMEASELAAEKLAQRDRCKNELDVCLAEAADDLRSTLIPDAKGGTKQRSEAQISSEVILDEVVQKAQTALEESKYELALATALCDSMRTKRDALKVFAELTISGYLSINSVMNDRKAEMRAAVSRRPITKREE